MPTAALKNAKAQENSDRTEMGHQQVEKPGLTNFGNAVLRGDQKVRRQCHGLPRQHECVRVVGEQNEAHAGEKQVILQTHESRRSAFTPPEVAGCKYGNAGGCGTEQNQEYTRESVKTQMDRQVRQSERQDKLFGRVSKACCRDDCQRRTENGAQRKESPPHKADTEWSYQTCEPGYTPRRHQR